MSKKKERDTFTQNEIGVMLNNAVGHTARSTATIGQNEARRRQIRAYIEELSNALWEDVEMGSLKAEELVQVLATSALFIHCVKVMKAVKFPYFEDFAKRRLDDGD